MKNTNCESVEPNTFSKIVSIWILSIGLLNALQVSGQSPEIDSLANRAQSLIYESNYEEAQRLTLSLIARKDLSNEDWFKVNMLYGEVIRSSSRPRKAVSVFKKMLEELPEMYNRAVYESGIYLSIAECYFDVQNYRLAEDYANKSIATSPDTTLKQTGHAVNYLILGFVDFLRGDYASGEDHYLKALDLYSNYGDRCDLPLVYTKMALVKHKMGQDEDAEAYLKMSEKINHDCSVDIYGVLIKETRYNIYTDKRDYENALKSYLELDSLVALMEFGKQEAVLNQIESDYEAEIRKKELEQIKALDIKNQELREQRVMGGVLLGICLVAVMILFFLLSRSNAKKKEGIEDLKRLKNSAGASD
jgi:tetratricopeptide (TPR) repeat protein